MFASLTKIIRESARGGWRQGTPGQRVARGLLLAVALATAAAAQRHADSLPGVRMLESGVRDMIMSAAASAGQDSRVGIVDIDEDSLRRVGPWPWTRETLAELTERLLSDARASVVVFDLVLTEPAAGGGTGDARLVALAREGGLVAAQAFDFEPRDTPVSTGVTGGAVTYGGTGPAARASGFIGSFSPLSNARCVGNIGFQPDADGQIRHLAPLTEWQGRRYPTLALAALACSHASGGADPAHRAGELAQRLPVDGHGRWALPFTRRPDSYLAVPAADVLDGALEGSGTASAGRAPPLAGRIVLVGSSALGLADRVATPLSPNVSGVTVHAAALSVLLDDAAGQRPPAPPGWAMPLWLALSVIALWWSVGGAGGRLRRVLATLTVLAPGWLALATWVTLTGSAQAATGALCGYGAVLLIHLPLEWSWSQARVARRTRLLARYVAQPVLEEILSGDEDDPLLPRRAEITVLIADMQGYTRLTRDSTLEQAARLTKGFLDELTGPVLAHRGTLDRYTGDGLVSFWGAPIAHDDHADRAIDAALAIVGNVSTYNLRRVAEGLEPVTVRIGLASGSALVGDLGTPFRIAYTAVGDCINLASRLQQASREAGVNVLVSSTVVTRCRRHAFRTMGNVAVRGLGDEAVFTPADAPTLTPAGPLPPSDGRPASPAPPAGG